MRRSSLASWPMPTAAAPRRRAAWSSSPVRELTANQSWPRTSVPVERGRQWPHTPRTASSDQGGSVGKRRILAFGVTMGAAAVAAIVVSGAVGKTSRSGATPLPSATCGPLFYKGSGSPKFIVASDLPLQGAGRAQNLAMGQAIRYVLQNQYKFKAGKYTIGYQECDDSTAQAGRYDPATCSSNARAYANNLAVIGVLGTFNSGC